MMTIRWGIIGCGDVTEVKSGPGFQKAEGSSLAAVMRRTDHLAEDYAARHNVPRWYNHADALIADDTVDAVYIATPPGSHLELARKVAAASKPCYVEKPMARNAIECRAMMAAFEEAGVPLFVAYYRRRVPRFVEVDRLIRGGRLGVIRSVRYEYREHPDQSYAVQSTLPEGQSNLPWRLQAEHSGGGLIMDMGCHALDLLDFWLGPMRDVSGDAERKGGPYVVEDKVEMSWRHRPADDASAFLSPEISGEAIFDFFSDEPPTDRFTIVGEAGSLTVPCFATDPIRVYSAGADAVEDIEGGVEGGDVESFDIPNPPHIQQPLIQTIVDELNAGEVAEARCPSTGESALRTNAVIDAALRGYYGDRDTDFWSRPGDWLGG